MGSGARRGRLVTEGRFKRGDDPDRFAEQQ